jgi:hypothetical protein
LVSGFIRRVCWFFVILLQRVSTFCSNRRSGGESRVKDLEQVRGERGRRQRNAVQAVKNLKGRRKRAQALEIRVVGAKQTLNAFGKGQGYKVVVVYS